MKKRKRIFIGNNLKGEYTNFPLNTKRKNRIFGFMDSVLLSPEKYAYNKEVKIRYEHVSSVNGITCIFIMGLSMDRFGWSNQFLAPFVAHGFGVIRLDNRCTGGSSFVENFGKSKFNLADMANDAISVLNAEHIQHVHAVGASLGGMIVQQMALSFPDRILSITSLMSGAYWHPFNLSLQSYWTFFRMGLVAAKPRKVNRKERYIAINSEIWKVLDPENIDDTDFEWISEVCNYQWNENHKIRSDSAIHQLLAVHRSGSRLAGLQNSNILKLIIHGDADPLIPIRHSRSFVKNIQNSRLVVLEKMGHTLPKRYHAKIFSEILITIQNS